MATITLRLGKGSPLTNSEVDDNFTNLNTELGTKANSSALASYLTTATAASTYLPLAGGTLTGQLTIGAVGTANSPTLRLNTSSSGAFVHTQENFAANLTSGQHIISVIGKVGSTKNSGYIGYTWAGDASNSNYVTIGHWGNDDLLRVYADGNVTVGANTVLHAGNYNSYAPTLTGTGASGTWAINITGNAATATSATDSTKLPLAGGTLTGKLTLDGRNEVYGVPTNAGTIAGFMGGTSGGTTAARTQSLNTQTLLNIAALGYTGSAWVGGAGLSFVATENQAAGTRGTKAVLSAITTGDSTATTMEFNGSALTINGSTAVTSSNYTTYAPTLTGTGASGTWGISITGSAGSAGSASSATVAARLQYADGPRDLSDRLPNTFTRTVVFDFVGAGTGNGSGNYAGVMTYSPWTGTSASTGDSSYQLSFANTTGVNASGQPKLSIRNGIDSTWNAWYVLLHSGNVGSYALPLSGGTMTNAAVVRFGLDDNLDRTAGATRTRFSLAPPSHTGAEWTFVTYDDDSYANMRFGYGDANTLNLRNDGYLTVAGNLILNSSNYNSYSPTLTGTGASGTWGISITGNSAYSAYSDYIAAQTNPVGNFNVGLTRPKGASYTTTASTVTGAIKIKMPPGTPVHGMWKMTVKIYEYGQRGNGYTIELGCHLYPSTAHNRYQYMLTTDSGGVLPIRYGTDGTSGCIWIGENGTTWSYPQIHVTEFSNGFNNPGSVNWSTGTWAVSIGTIDNSVAVDGPYTTSLIVAASCTGTAGSISGFNNPTAAATANTIVYRDGAGHINANYIFGTYFNSSAGNSENPTIGQVWTQNTGDDYLRKSTPAHFISQLSLLTVSNYNSYAPTLTGGGASGTWGISISGNASGSSGSTTGNAATATTLQTNGTVSFTTDNGGIHVIGTESTGSNVRLGAAWNRPGIYNGSGTTAGGLTGSITIGSENSIYFVTQNVERGRFDNSGIGYASASFRAPIFYDSDDTTYYANPNSFSQFSSLSCNGDFRAAFVSGAGGSTFGASHYSMGKDYANGGWSHPHYSDLIIGYHTGIRIGAHYSGIRFYNNSPTTDANNDGNGDVGEALLMTVGGYVGTANHTDVYVNNNLFAGSSMRAPVYYDSNDTSYYTNPNSFSQMSYGNFNAAPSGRTLSLGGDQTDRVYNDSARSSLVINATQYPHLYINATTNISNLNHGAVLSMTGNLTGGGYRRWGIGIANTDPDCFSWGYADNDPNPHYGVGGTFGYTGTPNIRMWLNTGGSLMTTGDMRAPLFYDSNNTAYYGDFASTSRINRIDYTNLYWATNTNYGFVGPDVYADTINSGAVGDQLELCYHRGSFTSSAGSMRAPLFYDRDDTGYYVDAASTSALTTLTLAGNLTMNGAGTSTSIIFGDATKRINVEGYWFMFKGHENEGFRWQTAGQDAVTYTTRMQLTSSALTVNGNTALHAGNYSSYAINRGGDTVSGIVYYLSNRNTTSDSCPLQAYSNNGSGATMSFHRGGYYAVNFGLDSDNVMRIGGWSASANRWQLDMSGNMTVAGNVTAYSDERLKKDWAPVASDFVASLAKIKSGTYTRIDSEERQAGVSAQDFQKLLPETISADNEGTLSLAYGNAALVSAVELAKDNVELRARIERLESLIHKLIGD